MRRLPALTTGQMLTALGGITLAFLACLSPVHNDTWWHLAYGREMADIGGFAQVDHFSHVSGGGAFPNHQWLAERVFHGLHTVGGLPLLTAWCAALLTGGWMLCWRLSRGDLLDRVLVIAAAISASTLVWSVRPQAFTLLCLPLTVTLLAGGRLAWLPPVFLLWANLHGGVLLGLIAVAVWVLVGWWTGDECRRRLTLTALACGAVTLATPLGTGYWPEIIRSLWRSQTNRLQEWEAPGWPPEHIFFWVIAGALVALVVRRRRPGPLADRALVATALVLVVPASRSIRNIAPFVMLAGPAVTILMDRSSCSPNGVGRVWRSVVVLTAGMLAMATVATAWSGPWPRLGWQPVDQSAASAIAQCEGPLYNTYAGGGPIIWFVPGQRVFVDSRQDHLPPGVVQEATALESGAQAESALRQYGFKCAAVPPSSPLVPTLEAWGWRTSYRDGAWVVLVHP